jgi:hypothetical protein
MEMLNIQTVVSSLVRPRRWQLRLVMCVLMYSCCEDGHTTVSTAKHWCGGIGKGEEKALVFWHRRMHTQRHPCCLTSSAIDRVRTEVKYRAFDRSRGHPPEQSADLISPKVSRQVGRQAAVSDSKKRESEEERKKKNVKTLTRVRERATFPTRERNRWDRSSNVIARGVRLIGSGLVPCQTREKLTVHIPYLNPTQRAPPGSACLSRRRSPSTPTLSADSDRYRGLGVSQRGEKGED